MTACELGPSLWHAGTMQLDVPTDRPDLDARIAGSGFGPVRSFDAIGSTNTWLAEQARQGAGSGMIATAGEQSAGRGRLGRRWIAPTGSALLMSVLARPSAPIDRWPLAALAMGIAAVDAATAAGAEGARLKWPNDLVIPAHDDRKIAGILAELITNANDPEGGAVVVGIGTNVNRPPNVDPEVAARAIWLDDVGARIAIDDLLVEYVLGFARRVRQIEVDPTSLLEDYRDRCSTLERDVRVELPGSVLLGRAVDIDESGRLVVRAHHGGAAVAVSAGDVVHVRPATV